MSKKQYVTVTVYDTDKKGRTRISTNRRLLRWRPDTEPRPDGKVRLIKPGPR